MACPYVAVESSFVHGVLDDLSHDAPFSMRLSAEKAEKRPLTRLAEVGKSASGEPPSPRGEGNDSWGARERPISPAFSRGRRWTAFGAREGRISPSLLPGEKVDRDRRSLQPSRAG